MIFPPADGVTVKEATAPGPVTTAAVMVTLPPVREAVVPSLSFTVTLTL